MDDIDNQKLRENRTQLQDVSRLKLILQRNEILKRNSNFKYLLVRKRSEQLTGSSRTQIQDIGNKRIRRRPALPSNETYTSIQAKTEPRQNYHTHKSWWKNDKPCTANFCHISRLNVYRRLSQEAQDFEKWEQKKHRCLSKTIDTKKVFNTTFDKGTVSSQMRSTGEKFFYQLSEKMSTCPNTENYLPTQHELDYSFRLKRTPIRIPLTLNKVSMRVKQVDSQRL